MGDLRRWRTAALDEVFTQLGGRRDDMVELDHDLRDAAVPPDWTGAAASAAGEAHEALAERMRRLVAGVSAARRAVGEAADAVAGLRRALEDAEELARRYGFTITDDGSVLEAVCLVPYGDAAAFQDERRVVRDEVIDRVRQLLRRADDVDADLAGVLGRVRRCEIDDGTGTSLAGAAATGTTGGGLSTLRPPEHGTAAANAGWWASLSGRERAALLASHPEWFGGLDGLPAEVRDRANRARLAGERGRLEAEVARLRADLDNDWVGGWPRDRLTRIDDLLRQAEDKLAALNAIGDTLRRPDRRLLLLDLSGERARAAVAVGDPDTADHVAVFAPGLTTTVQDSLSGYDQDMELLRRQAAYELDTSGYGGSVATVTWIGYEPPDWGDIDPLDDPFYTDDAARQGARDLAAFYRGLDAARLDDPHLTALGHSYGSLTTGLALQENTGVDDAVFFGSPGLGTSLVENLQVPEGHTHVIEARNDPVADLGAFGVDPNKMDGIDGLSAREAALPDGRRLAESTGHSDYLRAETTSQYNVSVVVAGLPDRQVHDHGRDVGDALSWWRIPGTER